MTIYKTEGRGRLYNDIVATVGDTLKASRSLTDDSGLNDSTFTNIDT